MFNKCNSCREEEEREIKLFDSMVEQNCKQITSLSAWGWFLHEQNITVGTKNYYLIKSSLERYFSFNIIIERSLLVNTAGMWKNTIWFKPN